MINWVSLETLQIPFSRFVDGRRRIRVGMAGTPGSSVGSDWTLDEINASVDAWVGKMMPLSITVTL